MLNSIQLKRQLDNTLSAQLALLYRVKQRLEVLKHKHDIPFEMSQEFTCRCTEPPPNHEPYEHVHEESARATP